MAKQDSLSLTNMILWEEVRKIQVDREPPGMQVEAKELVQVLKTLLPAGQI
jgi:hypothetical protein